MIDRIAARYRRFAEMEASGHSPLYEAFALGAAKDPAVLDFLATLPEPKQQPNLLFAALRQVAGEVADWPSFRTVLLARQEDVRGVMLSHSTQTNEPGRCAVLLPLLSRLPGPLALLEVGASAGLCLLPDRYSYDYGDGKLHGPVAEPEAPVFPCRVGPGLAAPVTVPEIAWRAGLDLNPLDPRNPAQAAWLQTLVWPDQPQRLSRLQAALAAAAADPPRVVAGDLLTDLAPLAAEAPAGATLVVFHTAVLAYVADPVAREAFVAGVRRLGAVWLSQEAPGVFPAIAARARTPRPRGAFLLALDGEPMAWTDPHGAWMLPA